MFLELLIKGFIVGIAFIIPGVSGGTLAVYLGIYKKLLESIGGIFTDFKNSMKFLIPFGLGALISVLALAKLFGLLIQWNSFVVLLFFIGLLAGGIHHIYLKANIKKFNAPTVLSFIIPFAVLLITIILYKTSSGSNVDYFELDFSTYLLIIGLGIISATTMIVPGISGSAVLMVLGFYTAIVTNVIGNVLDFSNLSYNIQVILMFVLGIGLGVILFSKLISFLLNKYPSQTYMAILGFVLASIVGVFLEIKDPSSAINYEMQIPIYKDIVGYLSNNIISLIFGLALFVGGFILTQYLTKMNFKGVKNE